MQRVLSTVCVANILGGTLPKDRGLYHFKYISSDGGVAGESKPFRLGSAVNETVTNDNGIVKIKGVQNDAVSWI